MWASITAQKDGIVIAALDSEAAHITFACVTFAARIHEEIVPLARIIEQQLEMEGIASPTGELSHAGDSNRTR